MTVAVHVRIGIGRNLAVHVQPILESPGVQRRNQKEKPDDDRVPWLERLIPDLSEWSDALRAEAQEEDRAAPGRDAHA